MSCLMCQPACGSWVLSTSGFCRIIYSTFSLLPKPFPKKLYSPRYVFLNICPINTVWPQYVQSLFLVPWDHFNTWVKVPSKNLCQINQLIQYSSEYAKSFPIPNGLTDLPVSCKSERLLKTTFHLLECLDFKRLAKRKYTEDKPGELIGDTWHKAWV